jgi:Fe-S-cluster containining protein
MQEKFRCTRCGRCCIVPTVQALDSDMLRWAMEDRHYIVRTLVEIKGHIGKFLPKVDGHCRYLNKKNDVYYCEIYETRPYVCMEYPTSGKCMNTNL